MASNDGWEDVPAAPAAAAGPDSGWEDVPADSGPSFTSRLKDAFKDAVQMTANVQGAATAPARALLGDTAAALINPGGALVGAANEAVQSGEPAAVAKQLARKAGNTVGLNYEPNVEASLRSLGGADYTQTRDQIRSDMQKGDQQFPITSGAGTALGMGAAGALMPGGQAGSALGRIGRAAAQAGATGFAANPGDVPGQLSGAQLGDRAISGAAAAVGGTALSGAAETAAKAGPLARFLGASLSHMKQEAADDYARNPELAEDTFKQHKEDPDGLLAQLRDKIKGTISGPDSLYEKSSQPLLEELGQRTSGDARTVRLKPDDYKGTAIAQQVEDILNKQSPGPTTANVSVQPKDAIFPSPEDKMAELAGARPSQISSQQIEIPAERPYSISATKAQAQRLKRDAQKAANYNYASSPTPMAYTAASDPDAIAASNLGKAIAGSDPRISDINQQLSQNARMADFATHVSSRNPERLLQKTDSIGNTPTRAVVKFLDDNTGSNIGELADALNGGKAMHEAESHGGFFKRAATKVISKPLLNNSTAIDAVGQGVRDSVNPNSLQALLSAIYGK